MICTPCARGAESSVSAWDAADFRVWAYIPYWATQTQINNFGTNGMYSHVSDVIYFGGLRTDSNGNLAYASSSYQTQLETIRTQSAQYGFNMELSMFEVNGGLSTDATWTALVNSPTARANFVSQLKTFMQGTRSTPAIKGFNFDWERPSTAALWGNYTELAKELGDAIHPLGMQVSVCDYGFPDTNWDNTTLFDARVYDQLFIMGYLYTASQNATFATQHDALTGQGATKAFTDAQTAIGVGTYTEGASTIGLSSIAAANPNLPYDAGSYTGTIGGTTGTWTFESRLQVRQKTQVALSRNMQGMFSWTLHYDATNALGLDRVMQHYVMVKRDIPDLNLNGKVDATDATTLANNMGITTTNTGMATDAAFDAFYMAGDWEKGDHDGNGFVNQTDANWLAARYNGLGVTLPDRLAFTGTFENFAGSTGVNGRWQGIHDRFGALLETSNFTQNGTGTLVWTGSGAGASKHSNNFVTIRNQNAAELSAELNGTTRTMKAELSSPADLGQATDTYVTFLVRENTATLSAAQLASANRTLSLDFLDSNGGRQFDFAISGSQQKLAIDSLVDAAGQDTSTSGFTSNNTYLFVAKIAGNGAGANLMQASLFPTGSMVANFTDPSFQWMITAQGSAAYNPLISGIQFTSNQDANFTVSNVWIGNAAAIIPATLTSQGDFNNDGVVDSADYIVWRSSMGQTGSGLAADGNGDNQVDMGDILTWRAHFGMAVTASGAGLGGAAVPEPTTWLLCVAVLASWITARTARCK
ncbi:MAG TPA: glycosyl hydrolase family 18 protein [Lacipirellulaceae bacterium]|nr:glycosyl hydrolase family 18 protein [Lacipirellulaceae bacterium]